MMRCKVCKGEMKPAGKVVFTNPVTKRKKESYVLRCERCGHRVIK
jgi:DNA-directed RNA polymerase subunit RPC12/RpoP